MEKIELIPAKDLPVTETEAVDVLCVDPATGVLARKSGANFGGGGGSGGGLVIHPTAEDEIGPSDSQIIVTINSVTSNEVMAAVEAGGTVYINAQELLGGYTLIALAMVSYSDGLVAGVAVFPSGPNQLVPTIIMFPNGDWAPPGVETAE